MRRYDIDFVMAFVGHTKLTVRSKLTLEDFFTDWLDNLFFHFVVRLFKGESASLYNS
jgi:hypothetical protein